MSEALLVAELARHRSALREIVRKVEPALEPGCQCEPCRSLLAQVVDTAQQTLTE